MEPIKDVLVMSRLANSLIVQTQQALGFTARERVRLDSDNHKIFAAHGTSVRVYLAGEAYPPCNLEVVFDWANDAATLYVDSVTSLLRPGIALDIDLYDRTCEDDWGPQEFEIQITEEIKERIPLWGKQPRNPNSQQAHRPVRVTGVSAGGY